MCCGLCGQKGPYIYQRYTGSLVFRACIDWLLLGKRFFILKFGLHVDTKFHVGVPGPDGLGGRTLEDKKGEKTHSLVEMLRCHFFFPGLTSSKTGMSMRYRLKSPHSLSSSSLFLSPSPILSSPAWSSSLPVFCGRTCSRPLSIILSILRNQTLKKNLS